MTLGLRTWETLPSSGACSRVDRKKLVGALSSKIGAALEPGHRKHIYFVAYLPSPTGKKDKVRVAKFSHSQKDFLDDYIVRDTYRRMRLKKEELVDFVECAVTERQAKKLYADRAPS